MEGIRDAIKGVLPLSTDNIGRVVNGGARPLMPLLRAVNAGCWVLLERHRAVELATFHRLSRRSQVFSDPSLLFSQQAAHNPKPGAGGNKKKDLRHGSNPKTRPKRPGFDRRNDVFR